MRDEKEKTAIHRVILATGEAMEKQLLIEEDDIENDITARLSTARTLVVVALSKAFKDDKQEIKKALEWFCDDLTTHMAAMVAQTNETRH